MERLTANPTPHPLDAAARLLDAFEEAVRSEERKDQPGANYYAVRPYVERVAEARAAVIASLRAADDLAEGVRHAEREKAILGVHHTRLPELAERFAAARAHPPTKEPADG